VYEYKTVKLLGVLTKAAQGWRLVTVDQSVAFFERHRL